MLCDGYNLKVIDCDFQNNEKTKNHLDNFWKYLISTIVDLKLSAEVITQVKPTIYWEPKIFEGKEYLEKFARESGLITDLEKKLHTFTKDEVANGKPTVNLFGSQNSFNFGTTLSTTSAQIPTFSFFTPTQPTQTSSNTFGIPTTQTSSNTFGQSTTTSNTFGQSAPTTTSSTFVPTTFGQSKPENIIQPTPVFGQNSTTTFGSQNSFTNPSAFTTQVSTSPFTVASNPFTSNSTLFNTTSSPFSTQQPTSPFGTTNFFSQSLNSPTFVDNQKSTNPFGSFTNKKR